MKSMGKKEQHERIVHGCFRTCNCFRTVKIVNWKFLTQKFLIRHFYHCKRLHIYNLSKLAYDFDRDYEFYIRLFCTMYKMIMCTIINQGKEIFHWNYFYKIIASISTLCTCILMNHRVHFFFFFGTFCISYISGLLIERKAFRKPWVCDFSKNKSR